MLVSGIVVTIAFLLTSLTLSQLSGLEREAAAEKPAPVAAEWRFLHQRVSANVQVATTPDLSLNAFNATTFPAVAATFRAIEAEKGYDAVIRLAGAHAGLPRSELDLVSAGKYANWTYDGKVHYAHDYDGVNDGMLWKSPCPDPMAAGPSCIVGVYLYIQLADPTSRMGEFVLVATNQ